MSLHVEGISKSSYVRRVRWTFLAACLLGLGLAGGCFHPDVKNGGFACSMTDDPPCPNGFFCVNGLCQDHPGVSTEADLSTGTGGNGGGGGGGGGMVSTDMAHAIADLAQSTADLAMAACGMTGADCSTTPCCSGSACIPGFNICF
ncbi:MAG: hypothetical protein JWM53_3208 [bacterium]|nr:hypothetical protein [bacterium]